MMILKKLVSSMISGHLRVHRAIYRYRPKILLMMYTNKFCRCVKYFIRVHVI